MSSVKWTLLLAILPTGCGAGDAGDDFSNNLFTDLAPLLALFGERVTMQFMSQSMGWLDNIILAMAPLGIMTIIVSAIRVGGPSWLKSIIGRGRENLAAAEVELMSSTSDEVCELWNGHEIVRCMGSAPITEFICLLPRNRRNNENLKIETIEFKNAIEKELLEDMDEKPWLYRHGLKQRDRSNNSHNSTVEEGQAKSDLSNSETYVTRNMQDGAPNISLNSRRQLHPLEFYSFAMLGIIIQVLVVWYACHATYYLKYPKDGKTIKKYAAPCTVIGTGFLVIGLLLCSHVVESSTEEKRYQACPDRELRIIWIQKTQTVSDQVFDSSAIFAEEEQRFVTTSRRGNKEKHATSLAVKTVSGTIVSIFGFVVQFVGLRQMHWSVSVVQLGAVLAMTGVRAWIRRGLATPPMHQRLTANFEFDWLALALSDIENAPWRKDSTTLNVKDPMTMCIRSSVPQEERERFHYQVEMPMETQYILIARRGLGYLAGWRGSVTAEAISIAKAIEITMNALFRTNETTIRFWSVQTKDGKLVYLRLETKDGKWKAYLNDIEAALSLWLFSVHQHELKKKNQQEHSKTFDPSDDGWLRTTGEHTTRSLRSHGCYTHRLLRDMSWWLPSRKTRLMKAEEYVYGELEVKSHRVIGGDSSREVERRLKAAREPGEYIRFTSNGRIELENFVEYAQGSPEDEECQVVTASHSTLKSLYALDMFSAFMWAVAKNLNRRIEENAEIFPCEAGSDDSWRSFTLKSSRLSNLARDVESTGLGSLEEVYLSIIPPLSAEQKLPQVQAIIELVREHAKQHEEQQQWHDATEKYQWLRQLAKTFPVTSMFAIKATAVFLEYSGRVMMAIEFAKNLGYPVLETLKYSEYRLGRELDSADDCETVRRLKYKYKLYELGRKGPSMLRRQSSVTEAEFYRECEDSLNKGEENERDWRDDFERTALHYRAILGRRPLVAAKVWRVNVADLSGWTPLHYACLWGREYMAQALVQQDAAIEARGRDGEAPLHCAATNQNTRVVSFLVSAGANVDVRDAWGSTPLQWAINRGHEDVIRYLWPRADKRLGDRQSRTVLHYAANVGRLCPTNLPDWKSDVDINARDTWHWTPLHLAAASGHEGAVSQLAELGADIEVQDRVGRTPLHLAAENGHEAATKLLIELGANLAVESLSGSTLLHSTAEGGNAAIAELLIIDKGVKIDDHYESEETPLHVAAKGGHEAMARLLVTKGANIAAENRAKATPLHVAASDAIARLLIEQGANLDTKDSYGDTPLHTAASCGHASVVKMLIDNGAVLDAKNGNEETPLHLAARNGHDQVSALLIENGADTEVKDDVEATPLRVAVREKHEQIVRILIASGADKESKDQAGITPLRAALRLTSHRMTEQLLEAGADQQVRDIGGMTLLHLAVLLFCDQHLVKLLIQHGADLDAMDDMGRTPLHIAARTRNTAVTKLLIASGANQEARDNYGSTPREVAWRDRTEDATRGGDASR